MGHPINKGCSKICLWQNTQGGHNDWDRLLRGDAEYLAGFVDACRKIYEQIGHPAYARELLGCWGLRDPGGALHYGRKDRYRWAAALPYPCDENDEE